METKTTIWRSTAWRSTAALSVAALLLTACGEGDEPEGNGGAEETEAPEATEAPEDEETEEAEPTEPAEDTEPAEGEDEDVDAEGSGDLLSAEEIQELLLDQDEFPVEVEEFESVDVSEEVPAGTATMPNVETCEQLAEIMQDPEAAMEGDSDVPDGPEIDFSGALNMGMWNVASPDPDEIGMLQTSIISYEDLSGYAEDDEVLQDCDGETLTMEQQGVQMDMTFEYLDYGEWEGVNILISAETGEETIEYDVVSLGYYDGDNVLTVGASGAGLDYYEEFADAQLEKYESAQ